jgi:hypothetical protein
VAVPVSVAAIAIVRPDSPPVHSSAVRSSENEPGTSSSQPSWRIVTGAEAIREVGRELGLQFDLAGHRVVRAAEARQLEPVPPRIGERGVERERPTEQPQHLVVHAPLGVGRRRPPADLGPHQAERPVQEVPRVDRVGPPRRHVDREP